jgi:CRISPR/Cas system Type II protein with McrA/HNH and RuvC-like nuclease domain
MSAEGLEKAKLLDDIAETLTKMQTDNEVENALGKLGLSSDVISSLQLVGFKGYKNLSLKALRNILPSLEKGESYSSACSIAGYDKFKKIEPQKFLPELTTYTFERYKHGKKTSYTEKRFKEVNNPVVARAFCQARLVLNALIAEYGSPEYVHVELARDVGKSKKQRDEIDSRQKENRARRENRRSEFKQDKGYEPNGELDLKLQLLDEQMQQCAYTLQMLDRNLVISDPFYAEVDHIWPRSKTFDNSSANKVLVLAHANQNKGNQIPYDYIRTDRRFGDTQDERELHWRRVEKHTLTCHDMNAKKRERITAKVLDSDEFTARNLVDTRYATRMFANWVRTRLLFAGQTKDEIVDIDSAESGKSRLEKYHKTRVRTPQGGVVAFLRSRWLGDKIKDREASDKHHAIDALITAACSPSLIKRVNDWFASEENYPNRFVRNKDGAYTDRRTGDVISKQQAREQGIFLPAPWDEKDKNAGQVFRKLFETEYEKVFVSRMLRKKKNLKLHDSNPMAWKRQNKMTRVRLYNLKIQQLDLENKKLYDPVSAEKYLLRNKALLITLRAQLEKHKDAKEAFKDTFEFRGQKIRTIKLPEQTAKRAAKAIDENGLNSLTQPAAHKTIKLTDLTLEQLTVEKLGEQFFSRNDKLIHALVEQLKNHGGNAEKAFPNSEFYPFGKGVSKNNNPLPCIRSIRLPNNKSSGLFVRGGLAELGSSLRTDVYWENTKYQFKPIYKAPKQNVLNKNRDFEEDNYLFSLTQDDLLEVVLLDGTKIFGYFVMYEGDGRMKIREHDKKKKDAFRFSVSSIKLLRKFEISILGDLKEVEATVKHGLA